MSERIVYHCDKCKRTIQKEDDIYELTIGNYVIKGDDPNGCNIAPSDKYKEHEFDLCKRCANYIWCKITDGTGDDNI